MKVCQKTEGDEEDNYDEDNAGVFTTNLAVLCQNKIFPSTVMNPYFLTSIVFWKTKKGHIFINI